MLYNIFRYNAQVMPVQHIVQEKQSITTLFASVFFYLRKIF